MPDKHSVLLAEDDLNLGQLLPEYLEMKGFATTLYRDGEAAWEGFGLHPPDLCILDVMMPKQDGFTLARRIRAHHADIPIIFLTAKNQQQDRIDGFLHGADDYLTKPFSMQELLLRIQAILRRTRPSSRGSANPTERLSIGQFEFLPMTRILSGFGETTTLTNKEAQLLQLLVHHRNETLSRSLALKQIWGEDSYYNARSMDVYIAKLRKHLRHDEGVRILTIHGEGFKLVEGT